MVCIVKCSDTTLPSGSVTLSPTRKETDASVCGGGGGGGERLQENGLAQTEY